VHPAIVRLVHHLVGVQEIAVMLGVSRQRVGQLAARDDFPAPEADLATGRIWSREKVVAWATATGRRLADPERPA